MNSTQKQKSNIAAAKLLGVDYHTERIYQTLDGKWHTDMNVDIFTNPADCLAVVKMLILEYDLNIYSESGKWFSNVEPDKRTEFDTYEEAVAYACLEIGGKDVS